MFFFIHCSLYLVESVRKTWVSLRDVYRRTFKKHKGKKPPLEQHKFLKASHYGDKLSFLYPLMKESQPWPDDGSNVSSDHENTSSEWIPVLSPSVFKEDTEVGESQPEPELLPVPEYNEDDLRPKSVASDDFPTLETVGQDSVVVSLLKHVLKQRQEKETDDIGKFFDCMATTARTFTPQQRNIVKAKVFDIVSKMELEMLSAPSTSRAHQS